MRLQILNVKKIDKIARFASVHFVAKLRCDPQVREARIVSSLSHSGFVLLRMDCCQNLPE